MDSKTKQVLDGIKLILRYDPNAVFSVEHDVIYFGNYSAREFMSPKEQQQLEEWGWFQEYESFGINV